MLDYDIKIINGKVVNFKDNIFNNENIGIKDGKIIDIGKCLGESLRTIDATDKIVSPGFIDTHMHEEVIGNTNDNDDFDIANKMIRMGVTTSIGGNCGISWGGVKESEKFIDFINLNGSPMNYLLYAGYNSLRQEVGIYDRYRASSLDEQNKMYEVLTDLLEKGIIGISFGLEYDPGINYDEMLGICRKTNSLKPILSAHFRADGEDAVKSVEELIKLSNESDLQMHISHIGSCAAVGYMSETLDVIDKARNDGAKVEVDCYPYDAFSTSIGSAVFDEGWREKWGKTYSDIMLAEEPYKGIFCDSELFHKLRQESPDAVVVASVMNENEIIEAIKVPYVMVASDGGYNKGQGHPRGAGTFPRVLGYYVRELGVLSLVEALRKMTIYPAKIFGLANKGEIKKNMDADIVIFDENTIIDNATFENPTLYPTGIDFVLVNGKITVENNKLLEARSGKFIKRWELER